MLEMMAVAATAASALCVGRAGAADSVPRKAEVDAALAEGKLEIPQVV